MTFLELFELNIEFDPVENKIQIVIVELQYGFQRSIVIGVDKGQILYVRGRNDIRFVLSL